LEVVGIPFLLSCLVCSVDDRIRSDVHVWIPTINTLKLRYLSFGHLISSSIYYIYRNMDPVSIFAIAVGTYAVGAAAVTISAKAYESYLKKKSRKRARQRGVNAPEGTSSGARTKDISVSEYLSLESKRERHFLFDHLQSKPNKIKEKEFLQLPKYTSTTCTACMSKAPEVLYKPCNHLSMCKKCELNWVFNQFDRTLESSFALKDERASAALFKALIERGVFRCPVCNQSIKQRIKAKRTLKTKINNVLPMSKQKKNKAFERQVDEGDVVKN